MTSNVWNDCPICLEPLKHKFDNCGFQVCCSKKHYGVYGQNANKRKIISSELYRVANFLILRSENSTSITSCNDNAKVHFIVQGLIDFSEFSNEKNIFELIKKYDDAYNILEDRS